MSIASKPMEPATTHYRISVEQYHRMGETGIIPEETRVELLDGEIIEMSAIGSRHAGTVRRLNVLFQPLWDRAMPSIQNPVLLPEHSEPVPDFVLLRPHPDDYTSRHPGSEDVLLLIEVSDSSLSIDRAKKAAIYARHRIREYWIVDLVNDVVEVRIRPEGDRWTEIRLLHRGEEITPTAFPDSPVAVESLLPPVADG